MSLYRTAADRTSRYFNDGQGRDSYIEFNNGGTYKNSFTLSPKERTQTIRDYSPPRPRMESKRLSYIANGTGRDSYITCNAGGLYSEGRQLKFASDLRQYTRKTEIDTRDNFYKVQLRWLQKRRSDQSEQVHHRIKRLSEPKHKRTKFSEDLDFRSPSYRKLIINRVI